MTNDFLATLKSEAEVAEFRPTAHYDQEGDCIEFFLSTEPFLAQRLDRWVTVYWGRNSKDIVGSLIKNVRSELFTKFPGFDIEVVGRSVQIKWLLRAPAWSTGDETTKKVYRAIIDKVETSENLSADMQGCN